MRRAHLGRPGRRLGFVLLLTATALSGCSWFEGSASSHRPVAVTQDSQIQRNADTADPLVRVVSSMPVGVAQGFREPATGETLKLQVVRSYYAASGRPCREFLVTNASGAVTPRVACESEGRWLQARPLRKDAEGPAR